MRHLTGATAAVIAATSLGAAAWADGPGPGAAAAPAAEERKVTYSVNLGVTSDYIFRGVSQNLRRPAPQGGADITVGIFYGGFWASDVNFGTNADGTPIGTYEIDIYGGIKPVLGPVTFDLGIITYNYGGHDAGPRWAQAREQSYIEFKLGASVQPVTNLTTGITAFLSPQYTGGQGFVTTVEGTAAYELPKVFNVVPTIGGTIGGVFGDANDTTDPFLAANGKDSYMYWNGGLLLGMDKLSVDLRYWDTNIPNSGTVLANNFCTQRLFGCDARFVTTVKVTF